MNLQIGAGLVRVLRPIFTPLLVFPVYLGILPVALLARLVNKGKFNAYVITKLGLKWLFFLVGAEIQVVGQDHFDPKHQYMILSNFPGIEGLPALIVGTKLRVRLILRWFNFYVPVLGWLMTLAGHISFSRRKIRSFHDNIRHSLNDGESSVLHFPAGYEPLSRHDQGNKFLLGPLRAVPDKILLLPCAMAIYPPMSNFATIRVILAFSEPIQFNKQNDFASQMAFVEKQIRHQLLEMDNIA